MVRFIGMISIVLISTVAQAIPAARVVQCALKTKQHGVSSKGAYWLDVFANDVEDYGFEWQRSFVAANGYSILELGTSADAFKLGVNLQTNKGFFSYKDHGSGAGNFGPYVTVCRRIK